MITTRLPRQLTPPWLTWYHRGTSLAFLEDLTESISRIFEAFRKTGGHSHE